VLLEQLDKPESHAIGNRAALRELVAEAKAEAGKAGTEHSETRSELAHNSRDH
jgi:hypothetical protein